MQKIGKTQEAILTLLQDQPRNTHQLFNDTLYLIWGKSPPYDHKLTTSKTEFKSELASFRRSTSSLVKRGLVINYGSSPREWKITENGKNFLIRKFLRPLTSKKHLDRMDTGKDIQIDSPPDILIDHNGNLTLFGLEEILNIIEKKLTRNHLESPSPERIRMEQALMLSSLRGNYSDKQGKQEPLPNIRSLCHTISQEHKQIQKFIENELINGKKYKTLLLAIRCDETEVIHLSNISIEFMHLFHKYNHPCVTDFLFNKSHQNIDLQTFKEGIKYLQQNKYNDFLEAFNFPHDFFSIFNKKEMAKLIKKKTFAYYLEKIISLIED